MAVKHKIYYTLLLLLVVTTKWCTVMGCMSYMVQHNSAFSAIGLLEAEYFSLLGIATIRPRHDEGLDQYFLHGVSVTKANIAMGH